MAKDFLIPVKNIIRIQEAHWTLSAIKGKEMASLEKSIKHLKKNSKCF